LHYEPKPIDTSGTELPDELAGLIEILAENVHDQWALLKIKEGFTYGTEQDEETKKHPDLIPYKELPESKKDYDRKMAVETLKVILSLEYRISKD